jgi:hypothetical protein
MIRIYYFLQDENLNLHFLGAVYLLNHSEIWTWLYIEN